MKLKNLDGRARRCCGGSVEQLGENIPLKRGAQPEEVSKLVLFLAEDASYSTRSEFIIDGGLTAKF